MLHTAWGIPALFGQQLISQERYDHSYENMNGFETVTVTCETCNWPTASLHIAHTSVS